MTRRRWRRRRRIRKIHRKRTARLFQLLDKTDHFDRIHDSVMLLIFNRIGDFKTLCRCCAVSKRFNDLATEVENVVLNVNYRMLDSALNYMHSLFGLFCTKMPTHLIFFNLWTDFLSTSIRNARPCFPVFKKFKEIRVLKFVFPSRLQDRFENGMFLKWKAEFGPSFCKCMVLSAAAASSHVHRNNRNRRVLSPAPTSSDVSLAIQSFLKYKFGIGFATFNYFLRKNRQELFAKNSKLDTFVLTDANGLGVLSITGLLQELVLDDQLRRGRVELCDKVLNKRYRRADKLSLSNGVELKGVELAVAWLKEQSDKCDLANTFEEEPYQACLRELISIGSDDESLLYIGSLIS